MVISRQQFATSRLLACGVVLTLALSLGSDWAAADDDVRMRAEAPVPSQSPVRGPLVPGLGRGPGTIFLDHPNSNVATISRPFAPPFARLESRALRSQRVYARPRPPILPILAGVAAGYATAAIVARHSDSAETVVGAGVAGGVSVGVLVGILLR